MAQYDDLFFCAFNFFLRLDAFRLMIVQIIVFNQIPVYLKVAMDVIGQFEIFVLIDISYFTLAFGQNRHRFASIFKNFVNDRLKSGLNLSEILFVGLYIDMVKNSSIF